MTTAYRDTATRCQRCKRVTYGCAPLIVTEKLELGVCEVAHETLCQRCRTEVKDVIGIALRGERQW